MYTNRNFMIFSTSETGSIDYNEVLETSSETLRLSVNGIGDTILTSASNGFNGNVYIGSYNSINYRMNGKIAITRIYNKVLSTAEIAQNYNAFRGRFGL